MITQSCIKMEKFSGDAEALYLRYSKSYAGGALLKKYAETEYGTWTILGEDANADMHGIHHQPPLGAFRGTLRDAILHAVALPRFWSWRAGGHLLLAESASSASELTKFDKFLNLAKQIYTDAQILINSDSDWERKFDVIFGPMREAMENAGIEFDWDATENFEFQARVESWKRGFDLYIDMLQNDKIASEMSEKYSVMNLQALAERQ